MVNEDTLFEVLVGLLIVRVVILALSDTSKTEPLLRSTVKAFAEMVGAVLVSTYLMIVKPSADEYLPCSVPPVWNIIAPLVPLVTEPVFIVTLPELPEVEPPAPEVIKIEPPVPVTPGVPPVMTTNPPLAVVVVPVPAVPPVI
jgi:hypothetical protein